MKKLLAVLLFTVSAFGQVVNPGGGSTSGGSSGLTTSGLLASYPMNAGTGTVALDESGNGNPAPFCASAPTWSVTGLLFTGTSENCLTLPTSIGYTGVRTIEFAYSTSPPYLNQGTLSEPYPCWVCSTSNLGLQLFSLVTNSANPQFYGVTALNQTGVGSHVMAMVVDPGIIRWYIDGKEASYNGNGNSGAAIISNATNNPSWQVGYSPSFANATGFQGTMHYLRFFNRALTASEALLDSAILKNVVSGRGVSLTLTPSQNAANIWVAHGDSRTGGAGTGIPYSTYLNTYTNATYTTSYNSMPGYGPDTLSLMTPAQDCYQRSLTSPQNIASVWEGTNSVNGTGSNASTVFGQVSNDLQTFRNCGFTTIVANDPSRISLDTGEQAYNAYWRGLWQQYADGFVDFGADVNIGGTGAYANGTYYVGDGIHFTVAGYTLIATMFAREANYLKGSTLNNCTKLVTTSTYTLTDSDGCTKFNPTGGAITVTFYNVNDFTGRLIYVQNSQLAGINALTVTAASGQTIDGSSTSVVLNGALAIFQVVAANAGTPAGAGNNLHRLQ